MRYCLLTLGQAGVAQDGGAPVDFPVGKPFGILAYLALADDAVPRDELAALFWPDTDRSRSRHSLRQALSFLRKQLGEDLFAGDDPAALDPSVLTSDVALLEEALDAGDVGTVLEHYAGPFLATFQLPASPAWHHWAETQRRILEERVAAFLREEADRADSPERAAALLHRVVGIEPHRVEHRVALVDRLLGRADLEAATAALAEARQADVDDPEALAEMEEMIRAVREGRRQRRVDTDEVAPEFVGRTAELAALTAAWRQAVQGRRQIAVISGPTGIGKTRLAEELAVVAGASGRAVHVKASTVERRLDWGVTAELARTLYRLPGAAGVGGGADHVLRSLVPTLDGTSRAAGSGTPRAVAVSDALADLVSAVAYETPLLIVLDDMQWVDRASLTLLLRLARQLRDEPVMILLTFRSEELGAREHTAITALLDEEGAARIRLDALSRPELEELLTLGLREPPARVERLAGRLHDVTHGHPLFLVELLRSLQDDGVLTVDADGWRLQDSDPVELQLPASVRLVIHKRLEQLSDDARTVGEELAALPPSSGLERVRARTGLSDASFTRALNELLERAVVSWDRSGRVEFTHDQLREAMAESAPQDGRWRWVAAGAALFLMAAAVTVMASDFREPYGGGLLFARLGDSIAAFEVSGSVEPAAEDEFWYPRDPDVHSRLRARRLTDGRMVWFGSVQDLVRAPDGAIYWGPGAPRVELQWPGDDYIADVSPDGRHLAWVTEDRGTPEYDVRLRIRATGSEGDTGHVVTRPAGNTNALWAPDGTRLACTLRLADDSLLVISPRGDRQLARAYFLAAVEDWCGPDRVLAVVQDSALAPLKRLILDVATGGEQLLGVDVVVGGQCSPDGAAFVSLTRIDGRFVPTVTDIDTGERRTLDLPEPGLVAPVWLPDRTAPTPVRLRATADTVSTPRGGTVHVDTRLQYSDGSEEDVSTDWYSLAPALASALGDGTIIANRPGSAAVVAEYADWLSDTVIVTVQTDPDESLVLADDFRGLDTLRRWWPVGQPTVAHTSVDGRGVLELLGDGRYLDGIVSSRSRTLAGGTTVEAEFQLPLTEPAYQGLTLCLSAAEPPADPAARERFGSWDRTGEVCGVIPAYELAKWTPGMGRIYGTQAEKAGRMPEETDLGKWTHIALQVQADGLATFWIDRRPIAELQLTQDLLDSPLRVGIFGRTHGTYGYVRNFAWWAEPRYR